MKPVELKALSNEEAGALRRRARGLDAGVPQTASHKDNTFRLVATRGPLFRMGFDAAASLGRSIGTWVQAAA